MEVIGHDQNEFRIISVKGRLDALTAPQLQTYVEESVAAGKHFLVLDLQDVEYVSSGGLRALLTATKLTRAKNGGVALANLHPFVEDLLTMAGFNKLIPAGASTDEAISLLLQGGAS